MADDDQPLRWTTRVSRRVRQARLQVRPFGGLEVVIPPRFPRGEIAGLVERHADWARGQLARQTAIRDAIRLPDRLELPADGTSLAIRRRGDSPALNYDLFDGAATDCIELRAATRDGQIRELRGWIRRHAGLVLPPRLRAVAERSGLDYARVTIRSQKTRWGSCSARRNISLNDQLLFLPPATVDYLLVHELCHTREMNHSPAFWKLVERHCPEYRAHERLLCESRHLVPEWFLFDLYR